MLTGLYIVAKEVFPSHEIKKERKTTKKKGGGNQGELIGNITEDNDPIPYPLQFIDFVQAYRKTAGDIQRPMLLDPSYATGCFNKMIALAPHRILQDY